MTILAVDTSSSILSAALKTEKGVYSMSAEAGNSHSELLCDAVDCVLKLARVRREDIDLAGCMKGPGSFSGLRIGFAFVKGFSLALGKPYISVPTLECTAFAHKDFDGIVIPVTRASPLQASKAGGRFFCQLYRKGAALGGELDIDAAALLSLIPPGERALIAGPAAQPAYTELSAVSEGSQNGRQIILNSNSTKSGALDLLNILVNRAKIKENGYELGDDDFSSPDYIRPPV
ncbi:MAG: tRNA (adenosine(37)-N6)-threonylcarbamoyltransferase complex dimerization subunit type 1 TsaB [Spirochaetaceae bacterium]|jgi:tRNA threonylcarbamoyladenosine biosynthesis protein TsaB|nr:tRNA (adenosine(37)-N6)-threonylcarbamoyltransferase complex dimerization subunit type 1 TsaB [Spirochaetaceae bacterium]